MATIQQIVVLHTQINSIETQLRDMKQTKLHARVADLEEKVSEFAMMKSAEDDDDYTKNAGRHNMTSCSTRRYSLKDARKP